MLGRQSCEYGKGSQCDSFRPTSAFAYVGPREVEMNDKIRTQISGKYSPGNIGVFQLREKLLSDGIDIAFPVGSSIIQYVLEFAVTVPHEATTPFHETEVEFYKEYILYNIFH